MYHSYQLMSVKTVNTGIRVPRETIERMDRHKGYFSRNLFLRVILEEYMDILEGKKLEDSILSALGERNNKKK
jgi:hypothetical protein